MSSETNIIDFWLDNAGRFPLLPKSEVLRLAKIIQNSKSSQIVRERAIQKLIRHNLKLIPSITKQMTRSMKTFRHNDHCLVDLFQVGAIGLRKAAEKFDPQRGYAFSTYATPWIKQAIYRESYNMMSPIRVPESTIRDYYDLRKIEESHGTVVLKENKKHRLEQAFFAMNCKSIDAACKDDTNSSHHDFIPSKVYKDVKPRMTFDQIVSKACLNDFQKKVLHMKYIQNYTAAAIAEEVGESASKVRDNIKRSIAKIKIEGTYNVGVNPFLG
mgnify:CR=1 FL=1